MEQHSCCSCCELLLLIGGFGCLQEGFQSIGIGSRLVVPVRSIREVNRRSMVLLCCRMTTVVFSGRSSQLSGCYEFPSMLTLLAPEHCYCLGQFRPVFPLNGSMLHTHRLCGTFLPAFTPDLAWKRSNQIPDSMMRDLWPSLFASSAPRSGATFGADLEHVIWSPTPLSLAHALQPVPSKRVGLTSSQAQDW